MKDCINLQIGSGQSSQTLTFGMPNTEAEKRLMFQLRYTVYKKRGYIDPNSYKKEEEFDIYDSDPNTQYFLALSNGVALGTLRLINSNPLPTEKYFKISIPTELRRYENEKLIELGRLIVTPPHDNMYLPRGLIMLFLLVSAYRYALSKKYKGGYMFIKKSLQKKLEKRSIPFHPIDIYEIVYPPNGPLYKYFNQVTDKVIPAYFLVDEFGEYINRSIEGSRLFLKNSEFSYKFKYKKIFMFLAKMGLVK